MNNRILTADMNAVNAVSTTQVLYGTSIILTGLLAGLFYGYQCSVINGLGKLGNREYLQAFQGINVAILNPVFFISFMGSLAALVVTTVVAYRTGNATLQPYLLAATAVYAIGVFGITAACNVPLNETLASFDLTTASDADITHMRQTFERPWNNWHLVRTWASVLAFALLVLPLIKRL